MRYITYILSICTFLLSACTQELEVPSLPENEKEGVRIALMPEGMNTTTTRADGEVDADSRIEHVDIYAFNAQSQCVATYGQDLESPDNEVRMILPQDEGNLTLHAVCNYNGLGEITTLQQLTNAIIEIQEADGAFNGTMVMHGILQLPVEDIINKEKINTIQVKRLAAQIDIHVQFIPENQGDKFYLSRIVAYNIPQCSYLIERTQGVEHTAEQINDQGEYVTNENESEDTSQCEDAAHPADGTTHYFNTLLLSTSENNEGNTTTRFYMFENRRGAKTNKNDFTTTYPDKNDWQFLKGDIGDKEFPNATYFVIEGIYQTGNTTMNATYKIYLGKNNYGDFNVFRNCHHAYNITIRTCNDFDTRVDATILNGAQITPSFNNPLDAHYNVARCFGYTRNSAGWELYVEDPDEHPWLEVSFSPQYRPRIAGQTYDDERMIASSRFEGESALTEYFYIHTDEYIPENPNADESQNNTTKESFWRTGYVILRDKGNNTTYRLEVKQRPAQIVKMHVDQLIGEDFDNEYYVEYELEQKNITWGFLKYGANPVMTGMINDRWDGLANTRKLYQEAIKIPEDPDDESEDSGIYWGAYNGYYTVAETYPRKTDLATVVNRIPDNHLIKYVLSKNRDRNGNGYIDYDEIVWYVPALDELAELYKAMHEAGRGNVFFQNSEDRFHSSTPYLAGYTDEVPGRAFYVKMGSGDKAFAMRDRQYNVICCRRKGAWQGNNDAGYEGGITTDNEWKDETDIMPKQ